MLSHKLKPLDCILTLKCITFHCTLTIRCTFLPLLLVFWEIFIFSISTAIASLPDWYGFARRTLCGFIGIPSIYIRVISPFLLFYQLSSVFPLAIVPISPLIIKKSHFAFIFYVWPGEYSSCRWCSLPFIFKFSWLILVP